MTWQPNQVDENTRSLSCQATQLDHNQLTTGSYKHTILTLKYNLLQAYRVSKNVYFKSRECLVRNEVPTQISLIQDVPANLQVAIMPEKESPPPYDD